jgi:hypothetical protein
MAEIQNNTNPRSRNEEVWPWVLLTLDEVNEFNRQLDITVALADTLMWSYQSGEGPLPENAGWVAGEIHQKLEQLREIWEEGGDRGKEAREAPAGPKASEPEPEAPAPADPADVGLVVSFIKFLAHKVLLKPGQFEAITSLLNEAHQEIKTRQEGQGGEA